MHPGSDEVYSSSDDLTPVERWRMNVFKDAGFDRRDARALARSKADVHKVLRALEQGCSLQLAFEIFM